MCTDANIKKVVMNIQSSAPHATSQELGKLILCHKQYIKKIPCIVKFNL